MNSIFNNLLAAGRGEGGWVQLVFVIVLFIGYAFKAFINAKQGSQKKTDEDRSQPTPPKNKPQTKNTPYKTLDQLRTERRQQIHRAEAGKTSLVHPQIKHQQAQHPKSLHPQRHTPAQRPSQKPQPQPAAARKTPPAYSYAAKSSKPEIPSEYKSVRTAIQSEPEIIEEQYGSEYETFSTSDLFAGPDDIQKAIIYHEILSKPLALR